MTLTPTPSHLQPEAAQQRACNVPHATAHLPPASRQARIQENAHFRILRILHKNPDLTQRELAEMLGMSVGGLNYCLNALIDKGFVKMGTHRFCPLCEVTRNQLKSADITSWNTGPTTSSMPKRWTMFSKKIAEA